MPDSSVPGSRVVRGRLLGQAAAQAARRDVSRRVRSLNQTSATRERLRDETTLQTIDEVIKVLGTMKGAAMKLGQMLSMFDLDLVPETHRERFRTKLATLYDNAPAVTFSEIEAALEHEFGGPLERIFAEFDPTPIGAASIGQVYRGRLHQGQEVAVKIQYPGIDRAVRGDLENLAALIKLVAMTRHVPGGIALVDELRDTMRRELDFEQEALEQKHLADYYSGHPFIHIPAVVGELCTRRVLVTELIEGINFDRMCALPQHERNRIGEIVYRFYVGSIFERGEFCADPHPGNFKLMHDGRIAFLDFGLYHRMAPGDVEFERRTLCAASEGDAIALRDLMVGRGVLREESDVTADQCLEYALYAMGWMLTDEIVSVTTELATSTLAHAIDPRADELFAIKQLDMPPQHLLSRRADFMTMAVLGQLGAEANWFAIAQDWLYRTDPTTELGLAQQKWLGVDDAAY